MLLNEALPETMIEMPGVEGGGQGSDEGEWGGVSGGTVGVWDMTTAT